MSHRHLGTSAALKLLVEETESHGPARELDGTAPRLASCWLLDTERRQARPVDRVARRRAP